MPAGSPGFISLADLLRAGAPRRAARSADRRSTGVSAVPLESESEERPTEPAPDRLARSEPQPTAEVEISASPLIEIGDTMAALRGARLFRAALADALDVRLTALICALAADVLGRELLLGPPDIEMLASRLVAERAADGPLRLRVAPADAQVACDLPVVADPALEPGDAVLECRSGDIDARLRVRLANALAAVQT